MNNMTHIHFCIVGTIQKHSSRCNSWTRIHSMNTSADSSLKPNWNTRSSLVSLFPLSSVSLSQCLLLSPAAPPSSPSLSLSFSKSLPTPAKTDEPEMFPHCTERWMTAVLDGIAWVFFLLFMCIFSFSSLFNDSFSPVKANTYAHKLSTVSAVSACLSVSIFPLFRDIQSSASKLGYSMPVPNCPTAWGSDCSS